MIACNIPANINRKEFAFEKWNDWDNDLFDQIIDAEAILRLEKSTIDHKNKLVEFKVNIPGQLLFAKDNAKSFEEAIDLCIESLRKQILKHKEMLAI